MTSGATLNAPNPFHDLFRRIDRSSLQQEADGPASTDLQRAQRQEARRLLAFLRKVDKLEQRVERASERYEDCARNYLATGVALLRLPGAGLEDLLFLRATAKRLLDDKYRAEMAYAAALPKYLELINQGHRRIGAAKARAAKALKRQKSE